MSHRIRPARQQGRIRTWNDNNPIFQSIPSIIRAVHIFSGPFLLSAARSGNHLAASFYSCMLLLMLPLLMLPFTTACFYSCIPTPLPAHAPARPQKHISAAEMPLPAAGSFLLTDLLPEGSFNIPRGKSRRQSDNPGGKCGRRKSLRHSDNNNHGHDSKSPGGSRTITTTPTSRTGLFFLAAKLDLSPKIHIFARELDIEPRRRRAPTYRPCRMPQRDVTMQRPNPNQQ